MSDPASQASTLPYDPNSLSSTIPSSGPTDITSGSSVLNDATEGNHGEAAAAPQQVAFSENDSDNNTNTNNRDSSRNTFSEESSNAIGTDRENTDESSSQDSRSPIPAYKKFWSGQTVNVASRIYEGADKPELFRQHIWKSLSYNDGGDENSNQPVKRSKSHQIPPITVAPPANKKFKSDSTGVNDKCYTTPFNQLLTLGYVVSSKMIDGKKTLELEELPSNGPVYPSTLSFTARKLKADPSGDGDVLFDIARPSTEDQIKTRMAQHLNTSTTNQTKNRITQHSDTPTEPTESSGSSTNSISPESRRNQELQQASRERENLSQSPLRYFADESPSRRYHRGLVPGSQSSWDFALSSQDHAPRPQAEEHARSSETSRNWIAPPGGFPRRPNSPQEGENLYYPSSVNGESDAEDDTGEGDALGSDEEGDNNSFIFCSQDNDDEECQLSPEPPEHNVQEEQQQPAMIPQAPQEQRQSQVDDEGQQPHRKLRAKRAQAKPAVGQPLRRSSRNRSSKPQSGSDYRICFSNTIDPTLSKKIMRFFEQTGRATLDKADCTVFVVPNEEKRTASSYCMQFSGKDVIDLKAAEEFTKPQAFISYKARYAVNDRDAIKSMKEQRIYFSRKFGFTSGDLEIIQKGPLGSCEIVKDPLSVDEDTLVVIPDEQNQSSEHGDKDEQGDDEHFDDGCKIELAADFIDRLSC